MKAGTTEAPQSPRADDEPQAYLVARGHIYQGGAGNVHAGSSVYLGLREARQLAVLGVIVAPPGLLDDPAVRRAAVAEAYARLEADRVKHGSDKEPWLRDPRHAAVYARVEKALEEVVDGDRN